MFAGHQRHAAACEQRARPGLDDDELRALWRRAEDSPSLSPCRPTCASHGAAARENRLDAMERRSTLDGVEHPVEARERARRRVCRRRRRRRYRQGEASGRGAPSLVFQGAEPGDRTASAHVGGGREVVAEPACLDGGCMICDERRAVRRAAWACQRARRTGDGSHLPASRGFMTASIRPGKRPGAALWPR